MSAVELEVIAPAERIEAHERESMATPPGVVIGMLVGFMPDGRVPLVMFANQPGTAAIRAQSVTDLHGAHIGRRVALMFEGSDRRRPIIMGVPRRAHGRPLKQRPRQGEVALYG